jgi:hypothetical protein
MNGVKRAAKNTARAGAQRAWRGCRRGAVAWCSLTFDADSRTLARHHRLCLHAHLKQVHLEQGRAVTAKASRETERLRDLIADTRREALAHTMIRLPMSVGVVWAAWLGWQTLPWAWAWMPATAVAVCVLAGGLRPAAPTVEDVQPLPVAGEPAPQGVPTAVSMPRLTEAFRQAGLCGPDGAGVTEVIGLAVEPGGHVVTVDAAAGAKKISQRTPDLAVGMGIGVEQVVADLHRGNAARVTLHFRDRPPFSPGEPIPADPLAGMPAHSMWDPTPCAYNALGSTLHLRMGGDFAGLLLGGEPGSGKTAAADGILAWIALDPAARLRIADGKGLDSPIWWPVAESVTTTDRAGLGEQVAALMAEMDQRRALLQDLGEEKVTRRLADEHPAELGQIFLWVDELAWYAGDKDAQRGMLDLSALCRAFAIKVLTATQKPSARLIDPDLRDNLSGKWAFACGSWQASNMILGDGMKDAGIDAHEIPEDLPGAGWLRVERGNPQFCRTWPRDRAFLRQVAAEGVRRRQAVGTLPIGSDPIRSDRVETGSGAGIVADLLEAIGDATRIHADWAADLMASLRPDRYAGMDADRLVQQISIPVLEQVWAQCADGVSRNRRGWKREQLTA